MMLRSLNACFAVALAFSSCAMTVPAMAQTASVASAPVSTPDPRAVRAIDKLIILQNAGELLDAMVPRLVDTMLPLLVRGNTGREQAIKSILREEFVEIFKALRPDFVDQSRKIYLARFSAEELEAMVAFMETPVGRKMTRELPGISQEMFIWGQAVGRAAVAGATPRIIDRMRDADLAIPAGT